jgi:hypothetical protein
MTKEIKSNIFCNPNILIRIMAAQKRLAERSSCQQLVSSYPAEKIVEVVSEALDNFCKKKCEHRNDSIKCNGDGLGHFNRLCYDLLMEGLGVVEDCLQSAINEDELDKYDEYGDYYGTT